MQIKHVFEHNPRGNSLAGGFDGLPVDMQTAR